MKFYRLGLAVALVGACSPAEPITPPSANGSVDVSAGSNRATEVDNAHYDQTYADAVATADAAAADAAFAAAERAGLTSVGTAEEIRDLTPGRFSKSSFDNYVYGMTKRELRQRFGSPSGVHSDGRWFYFDLPVYDEEAGIKVQTVTVEFMGMGGMEDEIASVRY